MGNESIALAVVYDGCFKGNHRTVGHQSMIGTAHGTVGKRTACGTRLYDNAAPLSADAVVGKIVEHVVEAVTPEQAVFCYEFSFYLKTGTVVEIERRVTYGQGGILGNTDAGTIDDHRDIGCDLHILLDLQVGEFRSVPADSTQIDFLLCPTLQREQQVVLNQLGVFRAVLIGCNLYKHPDAVALAHLYVGGHGIDKCTIDVDAKSRLVAALQTYTADTQSVAGEIVNPERTSGRGNGSEQGVKAHRIDSKCQAVATVVAEGVVIIARHQQYRHKG